MKWQEAPELSRAAAEIFRDPEVLARRRGEQYCVDHTVYGRVELVKVKNGYLVAAELPPPGRFAPPRLSADLAAHLARHDLSPVLTVPTEEPAEALRELARLGEEGEQAVPPWSPFVRPIPEGREVVGEDRIRAARDLRAVLDVRVDGDPPPALTGVPGAGRRTLVAAAAAELGLTPLELPLGRILVPDRVMQSPLELLIDTLLGAAAALEPDGLLALTEAEILHHVKPADRFEIHAELCRLPSAVLVTAHPLPGCVTLACKGLDGPEAAAELLRVEAPEIELIDAALGMACAAARGPDRLVLPARLLFVVRLAHSLDNARKGPLSPDDLAPAVRLAGDAWSGS